MAQKSSFYTALNRRALVINQAAAGAGLGGVLGFLGLFVIATLFFVTENYFVSMFTVSIGLLIYVSGAEISKMFVSSLTIFFSGRHLITKAAQIQETLMALGNAIDLRRNKKGEFVSDPVKMGATITLPENSLIRDLQRLLNHDKDELYADYLAHSYYEDCHKLYEFSSDNYDFVSNAMPLFGLIGTIIGLIAMFDTLGADVTVEALAPQLALALKTTLYGAIFSSIYRIIGARFEQRQKTLNNDFETFSKAVQVLVENKVKIEIEK